MLAQEAVARHAGQPGPRRQQDLEDGAMQVLSATPFYVAPGASDHMANERFSILGTAVPRELDRSALR